ncbi:hypothetical protein KIN20_037390 [Parelaphostrongylus tenuis]|uniref:Uncharacterized protein n=1 Tax=Parelaphostrongylus tenuis TaxID=148309 RepID=A0AAD5REI5_PARTN|nr:hypothetical protein KIN20_037390 [Parelaphostrongylus tenuis]
MASQSIYIISISLTAYCFASEHVLQLQGQSSDPPLNAILISVPVNSTVIIRCERPLNASEVRWLHNGNDLNLKHVALLEDGSLSASFRLRGEDNVILPSGFRFCQKFENVACDHARACMADGTGKTSCV